jgi:hypothetical protein
MNAGRAPRPRKIVRRALVWAIVVLLVVMLVVTLLLDATAGAAL